VGVIQLRGTSTPEAVLFDSVGLQINVRGGSRDPEEEPEWVAELEERFRAARRYEEAQRAAAPRARDAKLEALVPCVRRERPVIFAADDEADIRLALRVAEKLRVRAILRGGRDGWKVAALLEEKGVPVLVGPVWSLPSEPFDPYDAPYANAGRLHAAGVAIGFQSGDDTNARNLPFHIGTAVAFGLPRSAALRALTLGAAEILGVDTEIGSITPGKSADLVITDGDPFEIRTHVRHVFIRGRPMPLETRHTRLYRQFHERLEVPEPAARTRF
jgi:imidazolonepropionase-like amidohydrolase